MKTATCHPERKHYAKELCRSCYEATRGRKRRDRNRSVDREREYRLAHAERYREIRRAYRLANSERVKEAQRAHYHANAAYYLAYAKARRAAQGAA